MVRISMYTSNFRGWSSAIQMAILGYTMKLVGWDISTGDHPKWHSHVMRGWNSSDDYLRTMLKRFIPNFAMSLPILHCNISSEKTNIVFHTFPHVCLLQGAWLSLVLIPLQKQLLTININMFSSPSPEPLACPSKDCRAVRQPEPKSW